MDDQTDDPAGSTGTDADSAVAIHIVTRYEQGGSERRVRDAIRSTPHLRHVVVVGHSHDPARLEADLPGVKIEVLSHLTRRPRPAKDLAAYLWLSRRLRDKSIRVVHTHQSKAGVLGRLAARRRSIPSIHSLSMTNFGPGFGPFISRAAKVVEQVLGRFTSKYAVVGVDLADRFAALGIPRDKFVVIRSSVDLERFASTDGRAAAVIGIASARPIVVYVGRFERLKGVEDLPAIGQLVQAAIPDVLLLMAGDGPLRASVEARARVAMGSENVVSLGFTTEVAAVMAVANVVVLPSHSEGMPQVLVQALASRTPVVSYDVDGAFELEALAGKAAVRVVAMGESAKLASSVIDVLLADMSVEPVDLGDWAPATIQQRYLDIYDAALTTQQKSGFDAASPTHASFDDLANYDR